MLFFLGGSTSGVTTLNKTPHGLLDIPFVREIDHRPLRDIARLVVFLIPHIPLASILRAYMRFRHRHRRTTYRWLRLSRTKSDSKRREFACRNLNGTGADFRVQSRSWQISSTFRLRKHERGAEKGGGVRNLLVRPQWLGSDLGVSSWLFVTLGPQSRDRGLSCTSVG